MLGFTRCDIARLIKGQTRPTQQPALSGEARAASAKAIADFHRANEDLYAIHDLLTDKLAALPVAKHEDTTGTSGDGQQALLELVNKCKKVTDEVILSTMDKLVSTTMKLRKNPGDYFMEKTVVRAELDNMREPISDRRFQDIHVQGLTSEYKKTKTMVYRDTTFDTGQMQSTMRHLCLDDPSRSNGAKGTIAGRGLAMAAGTTICNHCGQDVHLTRNCWKKRDEDKQSGSNGNHRDNQRKNKKSFRKKGVSKEGSKGATGQK